MTKEAKLQAAIRILPEWVDYDEEIKTLQQKVENENRQIEKDSGTFPTIRFSNTFYKIFTFSFFVSETIEDVSKHEEL